AAANFGAQSPAGTRPIRPSPSTDGNGGFPHHLGRHRTPLSGRTAGIPSGRAPVGTPPPLARLSPGAGAPRSLCLLCYRGVGSAGTLARLAHLEKHASTERRLSRGAIQSVRPARAGPRLFAGLWDG